ncbi:hypothetical protein SE17_30920, partial [Kouleothrix aurantiaca]
HTHHQAQGLVVGVDVEDKEPLRIPLVSIYQPDTRQVRAFAVRDIQRVEILDDRSAEDLSYFLRAAQSEEDRRAATLRLSDGEHALLVGYIAPAPAWRVSYRILFEESQQSADSSQQSDADKNKLQAATCLLQGWGLFDNQLDEDLEDVELTLVAGMPVSFRYRLYEPHTPERPLIADEERTVNAPIEFAGMPPPAAPMAMAAPAPMMKRARAITMAADSVATERFSAGALEASTAAASTGEERGALFQYRVAHPVSVARGPVTVLDMGDYAGEAVLPFTRAGGELIVPYAVELGINVLEEFDSTRIISGMRVRDEYLLIQEWDVHTTRYRIHNSLAAPATVTIELGLMPGYALHDTAAPQEQAQGQARWAVACAPNAETTFEVRQRTETSRWEQVRSLAPSTLQEFLKQRFLDEATYRELSGVLEIYGQIEAQQRRLEEIAREREAAYRQQQQIQGSLAPLGREGEEGALRSRYVATLGGIEDRLAALGAEETSLNATIAELE